MKCWCYDLDYTCTNCEQAKEWARLNDFQKSKLLRYQKLLQQDEITREKLDLCKWVDDNDLSVSYIPVL